MERPFYEVFMAHLYKKSDGSLVWLPEYVQVPDPVLLDPELSPMENAWRVVDICAAVWLSRFKVWASEKEDMEDLEQMARFMTMQELVRRVRKKKYNRKYSFYLNVRSCAYSIMLHRVIDPWVEHIKERDSMLDGHSPASLTRCDESFTLYDAISTQRQHCWVTDAEKRYQHIDWQDAERPGDRIRLLEKQIEEDYDKHCDDCVEFGIEPTDKESFIDENYTDEEKALFDTKLYRHNAYMREYARRKAEDPEFRSRKQEYNRQYYAKKKAAKNDKLQ